jgi:SET domain-containing protein
MESDKGRGVYTSHALAAGDIVEIAPVIVLSAAEKAILHRTSLHDYYFDWGDDGKALAIALGYGSLYNHDKAANLDFEPDYDGKVVRFTASKDIDAGTELTIDYHAGLADGKLWF